jgi:hypothetical protein
LTSIGEKINHVDVENGLKALSADQTTELSDRQII